jgi:hypothetical protein
MAHEAYIPLYPPPTYVNRVKARLVITITATTTSVARFAEQREVYQ